MEVCFVICFLSFILAFKPGSSLYCNEGQFKDIKGNCLKCPDHCQFCESSENCSSCINGYWGNECEKFCPTCKSTGFCNKDCKDGYTGAFCDAKCNGKCSSCSRTNAQICLNCAIGWYPALSCNKSCPNACFNRSCNAKGFCTEGCENGFHGQLCELRCSGNCKDNVCYQDNGTCLHGCEDKYTGTKCDHTATEAKKTQIVAIVIAPLVALGFITAMICLYLRRRKRQRFEETQTTEEQQEMMSGGETKTGDKEDDNARDRENTGTSSLNQLNADVMCLRLMCLRLKRLCCFDSAHDTDALKEPETSDILPEIKKKTKEEKLRECLQRINFQNKSDLEYEDEFKKLPTVKLKCNVISQKTKYRLQREEEGVFPYDENIVEIHGNDGQKLYVNASYIKDKADGKLTFIASAGSSKKEDPTCLWRLFWENDCETVVMLDTYDGASLLQFMPSRMHNRYWPRERKTDTYDTLSVTCTSRSANIEEQQNVTRTFEIKEGKTTKNVKQLHYTDWPEEGVPRNVYTLLDFLGQVKIAHMNNVGPLLVHGRCGTGRTGTFIALYILSNEVEDMLDSDKEHITDIFSCVENLRSQRVKMVESIDQYKFLHEALSCFVSKMLEDIIEHQSKANGTSKKDEDEDKN